MTVVGHRPPRSGGTNAAFGAARIAAKRDASAEPGGITQVAPVVAEREVVPRDQLVRYLHTLAARDDDATLVLKAGATARIVAEAGVTEIGSEVLDRLTLSEMAEEIVPEPVADRLVERRHVEFGYGIDGLGRFRTIAYSQRGSLALLFRAIPRTLPAPDQLGLPDGVRVLADQPHGLVVIGGPPGSGRTTTLHSMIDHLNRSRAAFITTVEEPVEVLHKDVVAIVNQLEVGLDVPSPGDGARRAIRQGAQVLVVDRVEDRDTAEACVAATESSHLVIVGVEARQPVEAIEALVALFAGDQHDRIRLRLAGTFAGLVVQHLVARVGGGRVPAAEVLMATTALREAVIDAATAEELRDAASGARLPGTRTLEESLAELYQSRVIDLRTVMSLAPSWRDLRRRLEQMGMDPAQFP